MAQLRFQSQASVTVKRAANDLDGDVRCASGAASRPCLVTLESGIQALVEIAGFAYVEGVPIAIGSGLAEDIDPADLVERGPDGIRLKGVETPGIPGPVDVESSHY